MKDRSDPTSPTDRGDTILQGEGAHINHTHIYIHLLQVATFFLIKANKATCALYQETNEKKNVLS
jgi:hypothetical protein